MASQPTYAPQVNIRAQPITDGTVLVNVETGSVFELNRTGTEIWSLLDGTRTLDSVRDEVACRYSIDPSGVARDVERLIEALVANGLVCRIP